MKVLAALALVVILGSVAFATEKILKRAEVLRQVTKSTVTIETDKQTFASGTVVGKYDTYLFVLTCYHVIEKTVTPVKVCISKEECAQGMTLKIDPDHDLALLMIISPLPNAVPLPIATKDPLLFDSIYLIGNANDVPHTASEAILSDMDSVLELLPDAHLWRLTGGFVYPGLSGGTAVNDKGELVCVPNVVAGAHIKPGGPLPQIGFCVSRPDIVRFLKGYVDVR